MHRVATKESQKQPFADVLQNMCSTNFAKLTEKHLCRYLYCFPVNFQFFSLFTEHLGTTASEIRKVSFLKMFFCYFGGIYFVPSQMFYIKIFWNFDRYWFAKKYFLLFPIAVVSPLRKSSVFFLFTWYFMIGNILVQAWLIWPTFHTASDHQKFLFLGYDLKKVLTILRNFAEYFVQELKKLPLRKARKHKSQ